MISFEDFLFESESPVLQGLVKEFGREQVFNKTMSFTLTPETFQKIFDVLNTTLFSSKLAKIPLNYWPRTKIIKFLAADDSDINIPDDFRGCFYSVYTTYKNGVEIDDKQPYTYTGTEDISFTDEQIFIDSTTVQSCIFIYAVVCICHEMIHYYDQCFGETRKRILKSLASQEHIDSHTTPTFTKKMREARANKIDVVVREEGTSFEAVNFQAYQKLSEDKQITTQIIKKDGKNYIDLRPFGNVGDLYVVNATTGKLVHFD